MALSRVFEKKERPIFEFDPSTLNGLKLWLDAMDINGDESPTADASVISTWADKSGEGNHAIAGTGTGVKSTDGVREHVIFNNTIFEIPPLGTINNTDCEMYVICKTNVTSTVTFCRADAGSDRFGLHLPYLSTFYSDIPFADRISAPWGGDTVNYFLWSTRSSFTDGRDISRNGTSIASGGNRSSATRDFTGVFNLGGWAGSSFQKMNLCEFLVFDEKLTPTERADLNTYLSNKWNITI